MQFIYLIQGGVNPRRITLQSNMFRYQVSVCESTFIKGAGYSKLSPYSAPFSLSYIKYPVCSWSHRIFNFLLRYVSIYKYSLRAIDCNIIQATQLITNYQSCFTYFPVMIAVFVLSICNACILPTTLLQQFVLYVLLNIGYVTIKNIIIFRNVSEFTIILRLDIIRNDQVSRTLLKLFYMIFAIIFLFYFWDLI